MIGWLLDTNVVAEILSPRPDARVHRWGALTDFDDMFLSVLTLGEYEKGLANLPEGSPKRLVIAAEVARLEKRFSGRLLSASDAVVRRWGAISGRVRRDRGVTVPVIDTMLAATAIEHGLYLATRNVKDVQHSGATVFNPWQDDPASFPIIRRR